MNTPPAPNPRRLAAKILDRVLHEGAYSNLALDNAFSSHEMEPRDRALVTELVYGTLTWMQRLDEILAYGVRGKWRKVDPKVKLVLRLALYQIIHLRVPDHAAVHEAASAARKLRQGPGVVRFVNGVLRGLLRSQDKWPAPPTWEADPAAHLASTWSLPPWLAQRLLKDAGPARAQAIAEAFTTRPSLHMRARDAATRDALVTSLELSPTPISPVGLVAPKMTDAVREALLQGTLSVQDEAAQLVGQLCQAKPGQRVLDACAGLGGKTVHLAQNMGATGAVVAVDPFAHKLGVLQKTFARHNLPTPTTHAGDLRELGADALGDPFDLVLVDAPCSGLGVLRRHPETRWTRSPEDLKALVTLQRELLDAAQAQVAPGGALVYSVCTFTVEEGQAQIEAFLQRHPTWALDTVAPGPGWETLASEIPGVWRCWPDQHDCDSFVMARLTRKGE